MKTFRVPPHRFALIAFSAFCLTPCLSFAAQNVNQTTKSFAQKLVEDSQARHPDATEIGISMRSVRGCTTIASTDKTDIGEKCEKDDLAPITTGRPYVEKEKDGFDVSVPLRDTAGRLVGSLGVEFRPEPHQTRAEVTGRARKIASEMAAQISSKTKLLEPVQ